jgi:hypothetical protein
VTVHTVTFHLFDLAGFCSQLDTTFQADHFRSSGSEKDMILAKILILACAFSYLNILFGSFLGSDLKSVLLLVAFNLLVI